MKKGIICLAILAAVSIGYTQPGDLVWKFKTQEWVSSSPYIDNGRIYIGSCDGGIYCLDAKKGKQIWKFETSYLIYGSPLVVKDKLYFGSYNYSLYCLDTKTGQELWTFPTGYSIFSSPFFWNDKLYFGSRDGSVYCLDAEYGDKLWDFETGHEVFSSPFVWRGKVYIASFDKKVYCLDAEKGTPVWSFETGGEVYASPVLSMGKIYIGSKDKSMYCLDAEKGTLVWKKDIGAEIQSSACVKDGKIFFGTHSSNLYCLDAVSGETVWKYETGGMIFSSPTVWNNLVLFGSHDSNLYAVNIATGKLEWKFTAGAFVFSSPTIFDGKAVFGSGDGYLYCVEAGTPGGDVAYSSVSPMDVISSDIDISIPQGAGPDPSAVAIVIGNKNYPSDIPPVEFALNDAKTMKQYFMNTFGIAEQNILYRENADLSEFIDLFGTKDMIETSQVYKLAKSKSAGTVYVYFSGHGIPGLNDKKGYLAPVSIKKFNAEATGYALETLYANLTKLKAAGVKKVVLIIDACFSGDSAAGMLLDNVSPIVAKVQNELAASDIGTVFLATTGDSYAAWYREMEHGLFTYYLTKALGGAADANKDNTITVGELQEYLPKIVASESMHLMNFEQIPQISGDPAETVVKLK
ncbi:MAG: hypothetical protein A2Y33_10855 [Spirochaetes bacterium GWF1_51_8]|nr:MAG: hypothetical protein A2Y33_10855 [Spirochaetes bacterium GWF1_51_8]